MAHTSPSSLLGTWRLVSCRLRITSHDDGIESFRLGPFGETPLGRLTMTPNGYFSVLATSAEGSTQSRTSTWSEAQDRDIVNAARPMVAYCGPYKTRQEAQDKILSIGVEVALDPTIIGTDVKRTWDIRTEGDRMLLTLGAIEEHIMKVGPDLHSLPYAANQLGTNLCLPGAVGRYERSTTISLGEGKPIVGADRNSIDVPFSSTICLDFYYDFLVLYFCCFKLFD